MKPAASTLPSEVLDASVGGRNVAVETLRALLDEDVQLLVFLRHQG